jgi:hypothetical protein
VGEGGALRNTGGGFAPVPGLPAQRGALRAVWAGNGDEVWIVGEAGQVLHRPPGQAFRTETLPSGSRTMSCLTVTGRGPGEAWVGGDNNNSDPMQGKGVLARFSGGTATAVLDAEVDGVLARGNKVFAVGYRLHIGDGMGGPWTQPPVPPYKDYLAAIHGPDADHLWAVGPNGAIVTWSAGALSSGYAPADTNSVLALSEREVYRAGVHGTLRHDGSAWKPVEYERGGEGWGLSLFALGEQVWQAGGRVEGKPIGMVWRLERGGTQEAPRHVLRPLQPPVPAAMTQGFELRALWGTSPDDLWAVGREIVDKEEKGLIAHLSGGAWKVITTDPMGQPLPQMHTIFGVDGAVWAGGKRRVLLRSDNGGATWTREEIRAADLPADPMKRDTVVWNGLWGTGKGALWGVANLECDCEAYVLQRNADMSWSVADRTLEVELNGIRGTGERDIWVAGGAWDHALLKHYDGRWQTIEVHADSALHGAWPGPAGLFVGGPYNLLRRSR